MSHLNILHANDIKSNSNLWFTSLSPVVYQVPPYVKKTTRLITIQASLPAKLANAETRLSRLALLMRDMALPRPCTKLILLLRLALLMRPVALIWPAPAAASDSRATAAEARATAAPCVAAVVVLRPGAVESRATAEEMRPGAVESRATAEELRPGAVESRATAEEMRPGAVESRATAEEMRPGAVESRATAEELRPGAVESRATAEEPRLLTSLPCATPEELRPAESREVCLGWAEWGHGDWKGVCPMVWVSCSRACYAPHTLDGQTML